MFRSEIFSQLPKSQTCGPASARGPGGSKRFLLRLLQENKLLSIHPSARARVLQELSQEFYLISASNKIGKSLIFDAADKTVDQIDRICIWVRFGCSRSSLRAEPGAHRGLSSEAQNVRKK